MAATTSRAASLRRPLGSGAQACLAAGWDVVSPEEGALSDALWERLAAAASSAPSAATSASSSGGSGGSGSAGGAPLLLRRGDLLHALDRPVRQFFVLLEVRGPSLLQSLHALRFY